MTGTRTHISASGEGRGGRGRRSGRRERLAGGGRRIKVTGVEEDGCRSRTDAEETVARRRRLGHWGLWGVGGCCLGPLSGLPRNLGPCRVRVVLNFRVSCRAIVPRAAWPNIDRLYIQNPTKMSESCHRASGCMAKYR
jgi:hypothetical protein